MPLETLLFVWGLQWVIENILYILSFATFLLIFDGANLSNLLSEFYLTNISIFITVHDKGFIG